MADFRLGELKPADVDYVNAFAKGYAAPDVMQAPGLTNTLNQQKIAEENRLRIGAEEYQRTGDPNALAVAMPKEVMAQRELARKRDTEELLPLMKIGVAYGGGLAKPETFGQTRQSLVDMHPRFDTLIPQTFTPGWYDQTYNGVVRALKLNQDKQNTMIWQGGELIDTGTTGRVIAPSNALSFDQQLQLKQTPGVGRAGGGVRPDVMTAAKAMEASFQEEKLKNPNLTRTEHRTTWEAARQAAIPNQTIKINRRGQIETTTKGRAGDAGTGTPPGPKPAGAETFNELPDAAQYKGRTLNNGELISDGTKWVPNIK